MSSEYNRERMANAVREMLDYKHGINKLAELTGIHRGVIHKLIYKKKPTINIDDLYKLMEHGMELNSLQIYMDRQKKDNAELMFKGGGSYK